jgi:hypothetical protein
MVEKDTEGGEVDAGGGKGVIQIDVRGGQKDLLLLILMMTNRRCGDGK